MLSMSALARRRRRARRSRHPLRRPRRRCRRAGRAPRAADPAPTAARSAGRARGARARAAQPRWTAHGWPRTSRRHRVRPQPGGQAPCAGADDRARVLLAARGRQLGGRRRRARRGRSGPLPRVHCSSALFFAGSALLQLVWAGAAARARLPPAPAPGARRQPRASSRSGRSPAPLGLPFGLLPEPEAVGPWDLACAGWELVVACAPASRCCSRADPLPTASRGLAPLAPRRCAAFVAGFGARPGRPLPHRGRRMTRGDGIEMGSWQVGLVGNAVIMVAYLGICLAIVVPLARSHQLRTNPLGAATAAIFFTCAVHHGASHSCTCCCPRSASTTRRGWRCARPGAGRWPPGTSSAPSSPSTTGPCAATTAR